VHELWEYERVQLNLRKGICMQWFWTWGGKCFGYRVGDRLFTHDGRQVGRFDADEVYAADGRYLGEVKSDKRLITHRGKTHQRRSGFVPSVGGSYVRYVDYVGYVMYAGYEDFPAPDAFR
jgi:hypothetical protein